MPHLTLDAARAALRAHFGYDDFRTPQIGAVEAVLSGRDALIILPTGGGKSLCFQIPALLLPGLTVVVSPLISLMADQVQALQSRGVAAEFVNSTLSSSESASRLDRLRRGELKLLYLAPERLILGSTLELLGRVTVSLLVVDEAHCLSEWGNDFRPSYLRLRDARRALGMPQTIALTATATPHVRADVRRLLGLASPIEIVSGFDRPNLRYRVQPISSEAARCEALVGLLEARRGPSVVYAATRRQVEQVVRLLGRARVPATAYHAGLTAERRARAQEAFMRDDVPVIVATNAFGMGIDKPDVRLVVHHTMSGSLEDYYQEAGRGGRDGAMSRCVLLFHPADRFVHDRFRESSFPTPAAVADVYERLNEEQQRVTTPVIDEKAIGAACRRSRKPADVRLAADFLIRHGLLEVLGDHDTTRLRVLATPLRLACEAASLGSEATAVLDSLRQADALEGSGWQVLSHERLSLPAFARRRALQELESRQIIFVDQAAPRFRVAIGPGAAFRFRRSLQTLESLRRSERAKLDAVVGYATTRRCRRDYILRYFGDLSRRAACARCDNCE